VRSYLLSKIEEGVARSTYRQHTAAIMKLEKALRMKGTAVPSFRPVIDDLAKAARAFKKSTLYAMIERKEIPFVSKQAGNNNQEGSQETGKPSLCRSTDSEGRH
jgi:hypothetical protein